MLTVEFRARNGAIEFRLEGYGLHRQQWTPIASPFEGDELDDIRWYIEGFLQLPVGADIERAKRIEATLRPIGERLYTAVFSDPDAGRALGEALDARDWLEIATEPETPAAPLGWPWELLADRRRFLADHDLRVRRTVHRPGKDAKAHPPSPRGLRVLLLVSRPDGAGMVPTDTVDAALRAVAGQPVRLDVAPAGSLEALAACLEAAREAGHPYDVVHFNGHGNYTAGRGAALYFEEPATGDMKLPKKRVTPEALGLLLAQYRVDLVLLEACRSATTHAEAPVTAGFAQGLLQHVPAVIAMGYTVHVDATRTLCGALYARLAKGHTVGEALSAARRAMQRERVRRVGFGPLPKRKAVELSDWFVPQLYATPTGDKALLARDVIPGAIRKPPKLDVLDPDNPAPGAFPGRPQSGFIGRLHELHRLERALHYKPAARIWGLAGMGKTTLARRAAEWLLRTGRIEGAAFVDFQRAVSVEYVINQMGALIGAREGSDREAVVTAFRRLRVLVVWDNLEALGEAGNEDEAAGLARLYEELTGDDGGAAAQGRLLITTRDAEQFTQAWPIALGGLWTPDARQLLDAVLKGRARPTSYAAEVRREGALALPDEGAIRGARVGEKIDARVVSEAREDAGRRAVDGLLEALGRHPLSIELVGPSVGGQRPGVIVEGLAARLAGAEAGVGEEAGRMRRLRAALDWSVGQLGAEAQEALGWLALFRGGVFEDNLLDVSEMSAERWAAARGDLARTGLVRVDGAVQVAGKPFLGLHPTLALLDDGGRSDDPAVRARFVGVYVAVVRALDRAMSGEQAAFRWALAVFGRAEANLRRALDWGEGDRAAVIQREMVFLLGAMGRRAAAERLGARRLRGALGAQARARAALDRLAADPAGALAELRALAAALDRDPAADPFDVALAFSTWGRAHHLLGENHDAVAPLKTAVARWRAAVEARPDDPGRQGNLSATLGDLGNALMATGDLAGAEAAFREAMAINEARGDRRSAAAGWGQLAQLAAAAGRYDAARADYARARDAAAALEDDALVGTAEQHLGTLEGDLGNRPTAIEHYRRALDRFLAAGHRQHAMQTRDLLGTAWQQRGDLAAARGWYRAALADAEALGDLRQQAATRHNLGCLEQSEAEAARAAGRAEDAARHLRAAAGHVEAARDIFKGRSDKPSQSASYYHLGLIYRMQGRLPEARAALDAGLAIKAEIGAHNIWQDHRALADVCAAQGHAEAAAAHRAAADAIQTTAVYNARRHAFLAGTAQLAAAARTRRGLPPEVAGERDALASYPTWLGALAGYFTALADPAAPAPALPAGLPDDLRATIQAVLGGADPFDALPPEVQADPQIRGFFGRHTAPEPDPRPPTLPPTIDLFRHLCLAFAAPEPPPGLAPTLAALAQSPDPEHRAIAAHLDARRRGETPPALPPHLAAVAADVLSG